MTAGLLSLAAALGGPIAAVAPAPAVVAPLKQYSIEVHVLKGDPLGNTTEGTVSVLSSPTLVVLDGQQAKLECGQVAPWPNTTRITLQLRVTATPEGLRHLEVWHRLTEIVDKDEDRREVHSLKDCRNKDVRDGETIKYRLKAWSPSNQIWVEAKVQEVFPMKP